MRNMLLNYLALLFAFIPASTLSSEITLRLVYGYEQAFPYMMGTGPAIHNPPGIAVDIIKQAAQDIGVKLELSRFPDKRLFANLKTGVVDGNFIQSFNEKRLEYGRYPSKDGDPDPEKRITTLKYFLYQKQGDTLQATRESLTSEGITVAAIRGYSIVDDLKKLGADVVQVNSVESLFTMLEIDRVRSVALQDTEADYRLKRMGFYDIEKVQPPLRTKHYYLMLSHQFVEKHPQVADQLWARISEIRDQVTRDKLAQYYDLR